MRNLPRASHQGLCLGTSDIPRFLCWFLPWDWQPGLWWTRGRFFFVLVHMSQEGIWGWPLLMCLGAVKPHGYSLGFGFHVDSKIYRVLKQKILYVQKLWKSLLTHGINRKHFCPKLSWTELFFLTGFAEILLGSAGSKALATFFRNTLKQECSIIFLAFHLGFLLYQVRPLYSLHGAYTKCSERWSIEFAISWASLIFLGRAESCSLSETSPLPSALMGCGCPVPALVLENFGEVFLEKFCAKPHLPHWTEPSQGWLCYRTGLISPGDYCVLLEDPCDDQISRKLQKP